MDSLILNPSVWNSNFLLKKFFYYNLFTESTDIHCRYEVPREEPREAHGYFGSNLCQLMVALSVNYIVGKCKGKLNPTYSRKGGIQERGSTKGHMRSLPCPVIQKHTFRHTFKGQKENTPQESTQAHTPAGTHTPGQGAE